MLRVSCSCWLFFHTNWFVESLWPQTLVIDPHPENPLHPQPRLMAARPAYHAGHCHRNNHSLHLARKTARYAPPAACVLPAVSRHDLCVYAAGYADEEDLRVEVRGAAVGYGTKRRRHLTEARRHGGYGGIFSLCCIYIVMCRFCKISIGNGFKYC